MMYRVVSRSVWIGLSITVVLVTPIAVHGQARPDFEGVWSTTMTTPDDEAWRMEDYGCFIGCPASAYRYLRDLLNDPINEDRPYAALMTEAWRHGSDEFAALLTPQGLAFRDELGFGDEEAIACERPGYFRVILSPLPFEITQHEDRLALRYEIEGLVRTVYTDGRDLPAGGPLSLYGDSIGRYEGSTLVIETRNIEAGSFYPEQSGGGHSNRLRTVERYSRSDDGSWLMLELTLEDPVMLREPWVYQKVWRSTPGVEILDYRCETISGQP